jgi:P-type Mg2+ transporter
MPDATRGDSRFASKQPASAGEDPRKRLLAFASISAEDVAAGLGCTTAGLSEPEATDRLARFGVNSLPADGHPALRIIVRQLKNPLLALLLAVTLVSAAVGQRTDAGIIVAIVILSVALGFFDEYRADVAVRALEGSLTRTARVMGGGSIMRVPAASVVPGDLLVLDVGDILVADARLLEATDLSADEAVLTGESLPSDKSAAPTAEPDSLTSMLLTGSVLRSGRGTALVVATGKGTLFGQIAARVQSEPQTTEFQRGLRRFSLFLISVTATLTIFIFGDRPQPVPLSASEWNRRAHGGDVPAPMPRPRHRLERASSAAAAQ